MAVGRTFSAVVVGVRARIVEVEANLSAGLPGLSIVGRPDPSVNEARDRVRAAVLNSGLKWPEHKITVGLSPASLPKRGSGLDVAIALAILAADRQIPADSVQRSVAIGELGLDGRIRPVAGALASALAARQTLPPSRFSGQVISGYDDGRQLRWVPDLDVLSAANLAVLVARLRGEQEPEHEDEEHWLTAADSESGAEAAPLDLCDVAGQDHAKFALEIAAAGGHHLALLGRAGVGKTLLAERLPGLLPDLSDEQALDVTSIHQLSGRTGAGLIRRPPWAAPHHTASRAAMVGGGSDDRPSIGMASLAHRGVLFVDEAAEFEPSAIDSLREPMEAGEIAIARAGFRLTFPAAFQLVLASNPCPCGNALDASPSVICRCTPLQRRRYLARLSGPLMDRIDLRVVLTRPTLSQLQGFAGSNESSRAVAQRVAAARERSRHRLAGTPWHVTADVPTEQLLSAWPLPSEAAGVLDAACARDSIRGRDRVVRVAWTIADLAGHPAPTPEDVLAAIDLRSSEQAWAA